MAKSALIKSSIVKKYWMALTGLFLCLFLAGHLAGNLQLLFGTPIQFNEYAYFMTTNPAVKILSYVTYISILFHAIDGILLTIQNKKARPIAYVKNNGAANSGFASRNMAVLGTLILVFIVTHMVNFWAKMHFDENIPLAVKEIIEPGNPTNFVAVSVHGPTAPVFPVDSLQRPDKEILAQYKLSVKDVTKIVTDQNNEVIFEGYKDLHKLTVDFFRTPKLGLFFTLGYVLAMVVLGFHLWHGFASSFQSLGLKNPKYNPAIQFFGKAFSVVVPLLFAIIPLFIHFTK
jgi:succinate dehydrogenase / fumarate reductase cytochrome b subunit